jgi:DNA-binding LytR/AlgR family response regulator
MHKDTYLMIVEDDFVIAHELKLTLEKLGYQTHPVLHQAEDLLEALDEFPTDLVLLDIDLAGDLDGVDIAPKLKTEYQIPFVYLTAKVDTATLSRAALTEPDGYLVKPFREDELKAMLEIVLYKSHKKPKPKTENDPQSTKNQTIFVKNKNRLEKLNLNEVLWIEARDIYCILHTAQGQFVLSHTLKALENSLPSQQFIRIHRSYVVAIDKINAFEDNNVLIGKEYLPIGKTYKDKLLEQISIL